MEKTERMERLQRQQSTKETTHRATGPLCKMVIRRIQGASIGALRRLPMFKGMVEHKLQELSDRLKDLEFNPGDRIVREGEEANNFYIQRLLKWI